MLFALDWLVAWLLEKTYQHSIKLQKCGMSAFSVRNNIQVFHAQTLSIAYGQVSQAMTLLKTTSIGYFISKITLINEHYFFSFAVFFFKVYLRYFFVLYLASDIQCIFGVCIKIGKNTGT